MIAMRRNPARTLMLVLVVLLLLVLVMQLGWGYYVAPRLSIRKIVMEDDLGLSDSQIMEMLDISGDTWASVDEEELVARLEAYPVVRKAGVVKVFPDTLKLYVYRRRPLVVAFIDGAHATVPAIFDEEGYVVQVGARGASPDVPVISGPVFPEPALGAQLSEDFRGVLRDLYDLRAEDPRLFELVSEVELLENDGSGFDLKLYMNHIHIPILVDRDLNAETVRQAVLVLDVLNSESSGEIEEADMRGGHLVFLRGEGG